METKRSYGIDILRVICMLMVVTNHTLNRGGIIDNQEPGTSQYYTSWALMIFVYVAVDVFAVISGYVSYSDKKKPISYKRFIELWFMVLFYGVAIVALFNIVRPDLVSARDYIKVLFPVASGTYWFFGAYAGMYILKPILDGGVRSLSDSAARKMLLVIILTFSLFNSVVDRFFLFGGFSVIWISLLYVIGAIIKKTGMDKSVKISGAVIGIVLSYIGSFVAFLLFNSFKGEYAKVFNYLDILTHDDFYATVTYAFPTMITAAIFIFMLFSKINIKNNIAIKIIEFVTPAVFAVYIINGHHLIWDYVINGALYDYCHSSAAEILWKVISFSVIFTVSAIMVDILRIRLFKLGRIDKLAGLIDRGLNKAVGKIMRVE